MGDTLEKISTETLRNKVCVTMAMITVNPCNSEMGTFKDSTDSAMKQIKINVLPNLSTQCKHLSDLTTGHQGHVGRTAVDTVLNCALEFNGKVSKSRETH